MLLCANCFYIEEGCWKKKDRCVECKADFRDYGIKSGFKNKHKIYRWGSKIQHRSLKGKKLGRPRKAKV